MNRINCILEDESVILPQYETDGASGMDLRAWKYSTPENLSETLSFPEEGYVLKPLERVLIKTGIKIQLLPNTEAQIRPRSGLALKKGITVVNTPGTIDEDYRGDVGVALINNSKEDFVIEKGDRIAQMVFMDVKKVELTPNVQLSDTDRGVGGFNSTGTK
jgi:dUTP pyrophosphatase